MNTQYNHTQMGYLLIYVTIAMVFLFAFIIYLASQEAEFNSPVYFVMFLVILILISFATLNVIIDESYIRIKFGYGIYKKSFSLHEIESVKAVRNHWYYGWGIRVWLWPKMLIFNVSGFDAVELKMKNGKIFRIGTDEPDKLEYALLQSIRHK